MATAQQQTSRDTLSHEIELLRRRLDQAQSDHDAAVRYSATQSRNMFLAKPHDLSGARARVDSAAALVAEIKQDLSAKLVMLDEQQGTAAAEAAVQKRLCDFVAAGRELEAAQIDVRHLEAEYRSLPDRIAFAHAKFSSALAAYNETKLAVERIQQ